MHERMKKEQVSRDSRVRPVATDSVSACVRRKCGTTVRAWYYFLLTLPGSILASTGGSSVICMDCSTGTD